MESGSFAARFGGAHWRLWALVPIAALVGAVALFVSTGGSLLELVGQSPPPRDELDVRRVEFRPGEIRVRVTNPQREKITIASVSVDDAIVPFSVDGDRTLGRLRSATLVVPYDWVDGEPLSVGVTSSTGVQTTQDVPAAFETPQASARGFLGYTLIGLLVGSASDRARPRLAPVPAPREPELAGRVHGFDRGTAHVPGAGGARRRRSSCRRRCRAESAGSASILLGVVSTYLLLTFLSRRLVRG